MPALTYRHYVRQKIESGLSDIRAGRVHSHASICQELDLRAFTASAQSTSPRPRWTATSGRRWEGEPASSQRQSPSSIQIARASSATADTASQSRS